MIFCEEDTFDAAGVAANTIGSGTIDFIGALFLRGVYRGCGKIFETVGKIGTADLDICADSRGIALVVRGDTDRGCGNVAVYGSEL